MEFFVSNDDSWLACVSHCQDMLEEGKTIKVTVKNARKRSLSQNAFQHVIYTEVSKYLVSKGRESWTPEYTKLQLKNKFLGWQEEEYVDVVTGEVTIRETLRHTAGLSKGESFDFTTQIIDWAESIGCPIKIPDDSEYMNLYREQVKM